jgi:hypothetical protein
MDKGTGRTITTFRDCALAFMSEIMQQPSRGRA